MSAVTQYVEEERGNNNAEEALETLTEGLSNTKLSCGEGEPKEDEAVDEPQQDEEVKHTDKPFKYRPEIYATPEIVPDRFIAAEEGDKEKGAKRWEATLAWRKENDIDTILEKPHPKFTAIKNIYPQYFQGRSLKGDPVYYEIPGKIDFKAAKKRGISMDDLLRHFMYMTEYSWDVIEPTESGRTVTVIDVQGMGMSSVGGEVLDFIKKAGNITNHHYPERSTHIFIINVPSWFSFVWKLVRPIVNPVTREKISLVKHKDILKELQKFISTDEIPSDYGGQGVALGQSREEKDLFKFVKEHEWVTLTHKIQ